MKLNVKCGPCLVSENGVLMKFVGSVMRKLQVVYCFVGDSGGKSTSSRGFPTFEEFLDLLMNI